MKKARLYLHKCKELSWPYRQNEMSLFDCLDYRKYLRIYISGLAKGGRGELSKMAKHLGINSTHMSQVMSGIRELTPDQTFDLSTYLGHTEMEADYFSLLVQIERARSHSLKRSLEKKRDVLNKSSRNLAVRIPHDRQLSADERGVFYSSWIYSTVHLFTSLTDEGVLLSEIASRFSISKTKANQVIQFLLSIGVVNENQGRFKMGTKSTHIQQGSTHLLKHYSNWRLKALQKSEDLSDEELMFSGQYSLSHTDFTVLREQIVEFLKKVNKVVQDSPAEDLACLNLDWFWIK